MNRPDNRKPRQPGRRTAEPRQNPQAMLITTAKGLAPALSEELRRLGYKAQGATDTGVAITGTMADAMKLNLQLRTAHRVLWRISQSSARSPDELHRRLVAIPWERWISEKGYVCVTSSGRAIGGHDPRFVALKTKDAIVDRIQEKRGSRPDAGPDRSRSVVHIHWHEQFFDVYLDTSGEPLSHRGYRLNPYKAPMRETLAAACLAEAGWRPAAPLVNPMCGSGTLAIEAAMIASRTPAGWLRDNFGFMHLRDYDRKAWEHIRAEAGKDRLVRPRDIRIFASDNDTAAIRAARDNAGRAGVLPWITFETIDYRRIELPREPGLIIFNPEYGERIGDNRRLGESYKAIGDFMKQHAEGWTGAVFTGNAEMIKAVGLKPGRRVQMFNGPIECRLLVYDLYGGTRRDRRLRRGRESKDALADHADADQGAE